MGAAVKELSAIFDRYWNSEVVYPIELIGEPLGDKEARQKYFDDDDREPAAGRRRSTCRRPTCSATARSARTSTPASSACSGASARAFADPPEKLLSKTPKIAFETSVTNDVMMQVWQAQERAGHHLALHDPGRRRRDLVPRTCSKNKVKVTV